MRLLIVVDMQHDFIDGALGSPDAQAIVPAVKNKIMEYVSENQAVIFTRDTHFTDYLQTQEGKNLPIPHCIKGTRGWEIHENLEAHEDFYHIVDKTSFGYSDWATWFEANGYNVTDYEAIELVGLCTDICVVSNALLLKAFYPEIPIMVDASCCAGVTRTSHLNALNTMRSCQIAVIGDMANE